MLLTKKQNNVVNKELQLP